MSIDAENNLTNPILNMMKTLNRLGIKGNFLNLLKGIIENHTANIILNGKRLNTFPVISGTRQGFLFQTILFTFSWSF